VCSSDLLNGIGDLATRSDLLDRTITITFPSISENARREESRIWQEFDAVHPSILGGLLDIVAAANLLLPEVKLDRLPRMADFARLGTAVERALGLPAGTFLSAYEGNRQAANDLALETSCVGPAVLSFLDSRTAWDGSASELLEKLESVADPKIKTLREWPKSPSALSGRLSRITPNLRQMGIEVKLTRGARKRCIFLEKVRETPSLPSSSSQATDKSTQKPILNELKDFLPDDGVVTACDGVFTACDGDDAVDDALPAGCDGVMTANDGVSEKPTYPQANKSKGLKPIDDGDDGDDALSRAAKSNDHREEFDL